MSGFPTGHCLLPQQQYEPDAQASDQETTAVFGGSMDDMDRHAPSDDPFANAAAWLEPV